MTPKEFAEEMRRYYGGDDPNGYFSTEGAHEDADKLMCETLRALGYAEGVEIFEQAPKWHA